ncbi:phosphonate C-P lyase system protein PhnL [Zavarzinia compransoris]|uniref:Phosphonate C-P lyase system protein PhnL n=1 Tax=Zavarzinia compransoris TaxID=1264899 RepID=A0A317EAR7_9PROT|nr:phosphonate C-P lyase system protein PhnL [Zavarzinia compransoris]PWR23326.1 phosphonate C-P lyase system protein PhnL [Zavarzinia compransoris]TDP46102.1 alpha-D-ribose 1-methylphosphonate 5-triphosphate synthase subunit PhnL [Zavarzinia compransoris]
MAEPVLALRGVTKHFVQHLRGGIRLDVLARVDLDVVPGECVVLDGPSGVGKSTLLKVIYGTYRVDGGSVSVAGTDIARAEPRAVLALRRTVMGHVSQFLRVVPRVAALDIVAEPARARGVPAAEARDRAAALLARLNLPEKLWSLPPATFSGGEQQRVNIARGFVVDWPLLLLDEPTASLDAENAAIVAGLIEQARARGTAMVAICHDGAMRGRIATRLFGMQRVEQAA